MIGIMAAASSQLDGYAMQGNKARGSSGGVVGQAVMSKKKQKGKGQGKR